MMKQFVAILFRKETTFVALEHIVSVEADTTPRDDTKSLVRLSNGHTCLSDQTPVAILTAIANAEKTKAKS